MRNFKPFGRSQLLLAAGACSPVGMPIAVRRRLLPIAARPDLIPGFYKECKIMKVKDIMDTSPDIIRTSDTFGHLIKILGEVKYHVILVVNEEDTLVGIVTEGDIIKVLVPKYITVDESLITVMDVNYFERKCLESKDLTINEIMSKVAFVVHEDDPIIKAAALIVVNKIQSVPVVRDKKVVGIVPRSILLKHITKVLAET